jgi:aspartyl-tRNA(Asn)/glutamyl-tRNA(Gln) amidotransferase subunit B
MDWETVIGLEVHVQLATRSKLFCGCSTGFGDPPNSNVCPVCLGLPGALPMANARAIELGLRAALALECTVHPTSVFARKNYFYPDLPKGYQISQFDRPLAGGGRLAIESAERGPVVVSIDRLHLEEDAGKSLHDRIPERTAIDLNRAGVPLAEIVSGPDLRSPAEARAYLTELKQILIYSGVSECSMEKGSLRVDANLSIRPAGSTGLGTKAEVKNLNSFANVERALIAERERQRGLLESGARLEQITLLFDAASGEVRPLRAKEASHDYRYFADPDLPPLWVGTEQVSGIAAALPELPAAKRARLIARYALSRYDAGVLAAERATADYFEALCAAGAGPKQAANWVTNEGPPFPPVAALAELIGLVGSGAVSHQAARAIYPELQGGLGAAAVAARLGLLQVRDDTALLGWVDQAMADHPVEVARYRAGESRLLGFLTGQVMKQSGGRADPQRVQTLLTKRLEATR